MDSPVVSERVNHIYIRWPRGVSHQGGRIPVMGARRAIALARALAVAKSSIHPVHCNSVPLSFLIKLNDKYNTNKCVKVVEYLYSYGYISYISYS